MNIVHILFLVKIGPASLYCPLVRSHERPGERAGGERIAREKRQKAENNLATANDFAKSQ
jgi:hypothetical protein